MWLWLVAAVVVLLGGAVLLLRLLAPAERAGPAAREALPRSVERDSADARGAPVAETAPDADEPMPAPGRPAYVALVVDDLGRSVDQVDAFLGLGVELSYAVLPFERSTEAVVQRLARSDAEVLVHLPMEPGSGADPGPGALLRGMSPLELRQRVAAALATVHGAVGVNNHMGSALSADQEAMRIVLEELRRRELFFLDSRTSAHSVGYEVARSLGVPAVERNVFLDAVIERDAIREQFRRLLDTARREGAAVGICHPHAATVDVLRELVPAARSLGYRFVPVSRVLERSGVETDAM